MTFVHDFLENSAKTQPDKIALVHRGQRLSYREIDERANRLANAFIEKGVGRGDRVGIFLPNSIETVIAIFATLKAGGVFVVINPTTKENKLHYILNNCRASALVAEGRSTEEGVLGRIIEGVPSLKAVFACGESRAGSSLPPKSQYYADALASASSAKPPRVNIDLDLACLIYTSGTTGEPKGVMSDHSNVVFAASSIIEYLRNVENDIVIGLLPLSFDYGLYQLLMTFKFGGTLVLENGFTYPVAILKLIEQEKVTGFPGVPTIFAMLLQMDLSGFNLSSLRYVSNTAAALPPSHIDELRKKFPGVTIYSMYGLTETKRTLYLPPEYLDKKPGSVGIAIPGTEVWLEDETGKRLPNGHTGELVARGRHVMRGYWEAPEATAKRYRYSTEIPGERVCLSGDIFRTDEDGFMYFVGRKDDIIKSRGEKVSPKEVENVIYGISGVVEVAVIGVPDPILGQAIKAFVVVKDPAVTKEKVLAHCRANLEDIMRPKYIEFRDSLPKTTSGKITKKDLA
jgi:amino acid adenylation domain-containing protein